MEHLFWAIPAFFLFLRTLVIEHYKYKRFENFNSIYKDGKIEKLSVYEEKSKTNCFPRNKKKSDDNG